MNTPTETIPVCSTCNQPAEPLVDNLCPICLLKAETRRLQIIELAREEREDEGRVEIDDNAVLSESDDNGCYVQAWVWADFSDTPFDKDSSPDDDP